MERIFAVTEVSIMVLMVLQSVEVNWCRIPVSNTCIIKANTEESCPAVVFVKLHGKLNYSCHEWCDILFPVIKKQLLYFNTLAQESVKLYTGRWSKVWHYGKIFLNRFSTENMFDFI
jgi:hypothetical protein